MKLLTKRWRLLVVGIVVTTAALTGGLVWHFGSEIASPPRRPLVDYHLEFLSHPDRHGVKLESFTADDGTPCLVCTPAGKISRKGEILRKQLEERGVVPPPSGTIIGTVVLLHGRKGRKEDYLPIAERLTAAGFRCVMPDLPGHGDHPTRFATYGVREAGLPARMLEEAARKFEFNPHPAGLLGISMGGSVAMHATAQTDAPWKALVVISSFDSLAPVVEGQLTRYTGKTIGSLGEKAAAAIYQQQTGIPLDRIQPVVTAASLRIPTLIAHGTADLTIPMAAGKRLFNALPDSIPKRWVEIPGAGHDNMLITSHPIYADIAEWMLLHGVDKER